MEEEVFFSFENSCHCIAKLKRNDQTVPQIKKGEILSVQRDQLLALKWRNLCEIYALSIAHTDVMDKAPGLKVAHRREWPTSIMLSSSQRKCCHVTH